MYKILFLLISVYCVMMLFNYTLGFESFRGNSQIVFLSIQTIYVVGILNKSLPILKRLRRYWRFE